MNIWFSGMLLTLCTVTIIAQPTAASSPCPNFAPDTTYGVQPPTPGVPFTATGRFRVTRVVGPGLVSEYASPNDLQPTAANLAAYIANGVFGPEAFLGVWQRTIVPTSTWFTLSAIPGVQSARITVDYSWQLNDHYIGGSPVDHATDEIVISAASPGGTRTRITCSKFDSRYINVARRRYSPGGADLGCPATSEPVQADQTCAGINVVRKVDGTGVPTLYLYSSPDGTGNPITIGLLDPTLLQLAYAQITAEMAAISLSFKAMAPVVLMHGIRAGPGIPDGNVPGKPDWFESYLYHPGGPAVFGPDEWFKKPFLDAKFPLAVAGYNEFRLSDPITVEGSAARAVSTIAARFGSKYVHLVGHSGGGLWSRQILSAQNSSSVDPLLQGFAVRSLLTFATPHGGTFNADLRVAVDPQWREPQEYPANIYVGPLDSQLATPRLWSPLILDMRVAKMRDYNAANPVRPRGRIAGRSHRIAYRAYWGDANLDDSCVFSGTTQLPDPQSVPLVLSPCSLLNPPRIANRFNRVPGEPDESVGYESPDPDIIPQLLDLAPLVNPGQYLYRNLFSYQSVSFVRCPPVPPDPEFAPDRPLDRYCISPNPVQNPKLNVNDTQVTRLNATVQGFDVVRGFRANHTTIGAKFTASEILTQIRLIERDQQYAIQP